MGTYSYVARNADGKIVRGTIDASSISEFYEKMDGESLFCTGVREIKVAGSSRPKYKLTTKDVVIFCRKVSTMLASGITLTNCLDILCTSSDNPKLKRTYLNMYESVRGGNPLSAAMRESKGAFPALLINMIESGEESGNIDLMTDKLSKYYEKQAKIAAKIKNATTYPKLLAIVALGVIVILFAFVLPSIFQVFGDGELPPITRFMMMLSSSLVNFWYVYVVVIGAAAFGIYLLMKLPKVRYYKDKTILYTPKIGKLISKIYSARFASTLAIMYSSGLSLLNAIRMSGNVIQNSYIESLFEKLLADVSVGQPLSVAITEIKFFDSMLANMIKIGEESGSLDTILLSVSDFYESETESAIEALLAILEPALLIVMAIIIGTVLVSVMVPIFNSYGKIG